MKEKIIYLAGALLFGVASWLVGTVYNISIDTAIIKDKIEKVYEENCPYCIHAAHSSIAEHPLLSPTIKHSHQHVGEEIIKVND
eukprot:SAG31_NODE_21564_length_546_cov_1.029083_2_plen_84_part_00